MRLEEKGRIIIDEKTGTMKRVRRYLNGTKNSTEFHHEVIDMDKDVSAESVLIQDLHAAVKKDNDRLKLEKTK